MEKKDIQGWVMHNSSHFSLSKKGYEVRLNVNGGFYPTWTITKGGVEVDNCYSHPPVSTKHNKELAAKAVCEKILNQLIDKETLNP